MDWARYKARCDEPRVVSRWLLARTAALLAEPEASAFARQTLVPTLQQATAAAPLPKPSDHKGGAETDMFAAPLAGAPARAVLDELERLNAAQPSRRLNAVIAAWAEYCAAASAAGGRTR